MALLHVAGLLMGHEARSLRSILTDGASTAPQGLGVAIEAPGLLGFEVMLKSIEANARGPG